MAPSRSRVACRTVVRIARDLLRLVSAAGRSLAQLAAENLFLRKQLAFYVERQVKLRRADDATRMALVVLSWLIDWRRILTVVKPATLIRWHRKGFQLFWRWTSRPRGRPRLPADLQRLIAAMATANRTCGEERIASELLFEAWDSGVAADGEALYASGCRAPGWRAVADVEHVCAESRERRVGVRFLRGGDCDVPRVLHLRGSGRGHPPAPALECDRPSNN